MLGRKPVSAVGRRRTDARVVRIASFGQGQDVRAVLVDPTTQLLAVADGPVSRNDHVDVVGDGVEHPQRLEVILDGRLGVQIEQRDLDI